MKAAMVKLALWFTVMVPALYATAQEDGKKLDVDIDVNKNDAQWYQQPWVWIVGVAVFILLLVAIMRSGSRKEA